MITLQIVNTIDVLSDIAKTSSRHTIEKLDKDKYGELNVDWQYYIDISRAGYCKTITMKDFNKLVGYAIIVIGENPMHKDVVDGMCEALFIEEEYRGENTKKFMEFIKQSLKTLNIDEFHMMVSNPVISRYLRNNGFNKTKELWSLTSE